MSEFKDFDLKSILCWTKTGEKYHILNILEVLGLKIPLIYLRIYVLICFFMCYTEIINFDMNDINLSTLMRIKMVKNTFNNFNYSST